MHGKQRRRNGRIDMVERIRGPAEKLAADADAAGEQHAVEQAAVDIRGLQGPLHVHIIIIDLRSNDLLQISGVMVLLLLAGQARFHKVIDIDERGNVRRAALDALVRHDKILRKMQVAVRVFFRLGRDVIGLEREVRSPPSGSPQRSRAGTPWHRTAAPDSSERPNWNAANSPECC